MTGQRLTDYLDHMQQAASQARIYIATQTKLDFLADQRTQQAIILNLVILGEAATRIMQTHPDFVARFPQIPWQNMRGMRNRLAHGYFDINLDLVWETVTTSLPVLLAQLPAMCQAAEAEA